MNRLISVRSADASPAAVVIAAGDRAQVRFIEFFTANIRNRNTRRTYTQAAREDHRVPSIAALQPVHVAATSSSAATANHASTRTTQLCDRIST